MPKKIPVLLIIFNRIEHALSTLKAIQEYAPEDLFIAADGWRSDKEREVCEQTRSAVLNAITWDCNIHTLFQEKNLGCGRGPATAISWFFDNEPYGIILEDDNVPSADAFKVCEDLLPRYENNTAIRMINLSNGWDIRSKDSYTFIKYPEISGWASWARAWKDFIFELNLKQILKNIRPFTYFSFFEAIIRVFLWKRAWQSDIKKYGRLTFWDYQWSLAIFAGKGLCIQCCKNMISNIGFGSGSHCPDKEHPMSLLPYEKMDFPLVHPDSVVLDKRNDRKFSKKWLGIFFYNLLSKLKRK